MKEGFWSSIGAGGRLVQLGELIVSLDLVNLDKMQR